jgi:hypothetical protein
MTLDFETTMQLVMFVVAFGVFYLALTSDSL